MAIGVCSRIDGIKGASFDDKHNDWIACATVNWSIVHPGSATASTAGGHTAERVEMTDILFRKVSDLSSPTLMQTCAMGRTIPKAKFEFMRADGQGVRVKYFEIELENVLISRVSPGIEPGNILTRNVCLKFSTVLGKYVQQKSALASAATRLAVGISPRTRSLRRAHANR
jgi:type VI secretion system secreted protein Hcp